MKGSWWDLHDTLRDRKFLYGGINFKQSQKESFALVYEPQALKLVNTSWIIMACGLMWKQRRIKQNLGLSRNRGIRWETLIKTLRAEGLSIPSWEDAIAFILTWYLQLLWRGINLGLHVPPWFAVRIIASATAVLKFSQLEVSTNIIVSPWSSCPQSILGIPKHAHCLTLWPYHLSCCSQVLLVPSAPLLLLYPIKMNFSRQGRHFHLQRPFRLWLQLCILHRNEKNIPPPNSAMLCYPGLIAVLRVPGIILGLLSNGLCSLSGVRSHFVGQLRNRNSLALIFPLSISSCFLALSPVPNPSWSQNENQTNKNRKGHYAWQGQFSSWEGMKGHGPDISKPYGVVNAVMCSKKVLLKRWFLLGISLRKAKYPPVMRHTPVVCL